MKHEQELALKYIPKVRDGRNMSSDKEAGARAELWRMVFLLYFASCVSHELLIRVW
jgi:hypothetical protein